MPRAPRKADPFLDHLEKSFPDAQFTFRELNNAESALVVNGYQTPIRWNRVIWDDGPEEDQAEIKNALVREVHLALATLATLEEEDA